MSAFTASWSTSQQEMAFTTKWLWITFTDSPPPLVDCNWIYPFLTSRWWFTPPSLGPRVTFYDLLLFFPIFPHHQSTWFDRGWNQLLYSKKKFPDMGEIKHHVPRNCYSFWGYHHDAGCQSSTLYLLYRVMVPWEIALLLTYVRKC